MSEYLSLTEFLAKKEEDQRIVGSKKFTVIVETGDLPDAGTNANVFIELYGSRGSSGPIQLRPLQTDKNPIFERGSTNVFAVKLEQTVGELTAIRIGHDNTGLGPAWFLTRVEVVDEAYEEAYHFFIRQWLQDDILEKKLPVKAVHVMVMEARDLSLKNPYDLPDPYCRISYGPQHTTVKPARNTVNPLWEYGVTSFLRVRRLDQNFVYITVHNKDTEEFMGRLRIPLHHAVPGDIIDEWFELDTNPDETRDAVPAFEGAEAVADEDLGRERTRSRPGTLTPVGKPSEAKKDEKKDGKSEEKAKKDSIKLNKEKSAEKTDSPKADKRRTLTDKKEKKEKSDKDKKGTVSLPTTEPSEEEKRVKLADFQKQRAELEHRIRELNDKLSAITGKEEEGAPEAEKKKADAPTAAETPKKEEKPQAEEKKEESKKDDKKDKKEDEKKKKEEEKKKKEEEKKKKEEEEKKKKEEEKKKKEEEKKKEQERKQTKGKKAIVKPAATKEDLHAEITELTRQLGVVEEQIHNLWPKQASDKPKLVKTESHWEKPVTYAEVRVSLGRLGLSGHDTDEILAMIRKKLMKPRIHVRLHYMTEQPAIENNLVFFDSDEVYQKMKTGDIIAFSGSSEVASLIRMKTNSPYTHVGLVLRTKDVSMFTDDASQQTGKERILVVESTANCYNVPDIFDGKVKQGVTIFDLKSRVRRIDSMAIWLVPLARPLTPEEEQKLYKYAAKLHKEEIKYDKAQLWPLFLDWKNKEDLTEMFCSEMVSATMREAGRMDCNPSRTSPLQCVQADAYESTVPLMLRYAVGPLPQHMPAQ